MTRQPYFVNTTQKQIDVQGTFVGGMVQQSHPEKIKDFESVLMENVDIKQGGVAQARGAYSQTNSPTGGLAGNTQGRFKYENLAGGQDIVAINGKLYLVTGNTYTNIAITNLTSFQTTRTIEAVQIKDKMYFATGSGLVVYDGVTASLVTAYTPNCLEAMYIGTNGLAANPDTYMTDITNGAANVILGVVMGTRYGVVNHTVSITAYIEKISTDTLEYKFEYKNINSSKYSLSRDWGTAKSINVKFSNRGDYMIRVTMRKQGTTVELSQYVLPRFKVKTTPDDKPEPTINFDDLKLCNRIEVYYDRILLYGDTGNPSNLYVSHINNFTYFPRTYIVNISDTTRGALQKIQPYKNFLICFTDASIQMITGKEPVEYQKSPIHTTIGTKQPYSVQIMLNYITFVGNDNGVYILKSFNYSSEDKMNIERIDDNVRDSITALLKTATRVLTCIYDNQYCIYIENAGGNYVYRFYYDSWVWVRDSISLSFRTFDNVNNVLVSTSLTGGTIYKLLYNVFKDGTNTTYNIKIISKSFDFGMPHHRKKLKQYQLLAKITAVTTVSVALYTDNSLVGTTLLSYDSMQTNPTQKLKVMSSGRFRSMRTEITIPVNELVQLVGYAIIYKQNTPK